MKAGHFRDVHGNEIAATFATEKTRWEDEAEQAVATAFKQAQADADDRLATRERQWQAEAARTQEAAVQAVRGTAETEAAATLVTEKARWEDEAEQAVAAAVKRAQADADDRLATRERQWQAKAARTQEAAVQAARGTAERVALQICAGAQAATTGTLCPPRLRLLASSWGMAQISKRCRKHFAIIGNLVNVRLARFFLKALAEAEHERQTAARKT